ncbi:hypothetical protein [Crateriforma conspicua]|uniref:Periplasmic repressor CpxP n=1 Tax=Crateriforma conspicua TaxID=2527996 RepID=A0A5C5Y8T0_9PLAN|nr:hypothetical protein [Crateriforma conspicua]QDV64360.1 hypothetical protein Mal65_35140 [Crateriforma conspicua]TWT69762.1 hypothetical protein Pan14r_20540 [Crateriforma conspicua]
MNKAFIAALACALGCCLSLTSASADDATAAKGKKTKAGQRGTVQMVMNKIKAAELTAEQQAKYDQLAEGLKKELATIRAAGLTNEINKQRTQLTAKLRKENASRKEILAAVSETFSDDVVALINKATKANADFRKAAYGLLTEEQLAKLPEETQKQISTALKPKNQGKGKNKGNGQKKRKGNKKAEAAN